MSLVMGTLILFITSVAIAIDDAETTKQFNKWADKPNSIAYRKSIESLGAVLSDMASLKGGIGDSGWVPLRQGISVRDTKLTGRVSSIHYYPYPTDSQNVTLWAGTSSGGLWVFETTQNKWKHLSSNLQGSPSVGNFVVLENGRIVIATGDPWRYPGSGIYYSDDNGESWLSSTIPFIPSSIYKVVVHREMQNILLSATPQGLLRSVDAGVSWQLIGNGHFTDIVQDPFQAEQWYAGAYGQGVLFSNDNGLNFTPANGSPVIINGTIGRVSLTVSPVQQGLIFALVADFRSTRGIFRSVDNALTWQEMNAGPSVSWGQAFHTNAIATHPNNPSVLFIAQGGAKMTRNALSSQVVWDDFHDTGHADTTSLIWNSAEELTVGNDGGVYMLNTLTKIANGDKNVGLGGLQVFDTGSLNIDTDLPERGWVGLQDNGIARFDTDLQQSWHLGSGGDGGWVTSAPQSFESVAATIGLDFNRYYSLNSGDSFFGLPCFNDTDHYNYPLAFDAVFTPGITPLLYTVSAGTDSDKAKLFRYDVSKNCPGARRTWIIPNSSSIAYQHMSISDNSNQLIIYLSSGRNDPNHRIVRVRSPGVRRDSELDIDDFSSPESRIGRVTALIQKDNEIVWWAEEGEPSVWINSNQGNSENWSDITGNLETYGEGLQIRKVINNPEVANVYYLATNLGVFYTQNSGLEWLPLNHGLPAVIDVVDLQIAADPGLVETQQRLWLASYGYGVWYRAIPGKSVFSDGFE